MLLSAIVNLINQHLADELLTPTELLGYMDRTIDDINCRLNAIFPTFTEALIASGSTDVDYTAFPDKYIRSVVVTGTALKYYVTDEEGNETALKYTADYNANLFYMERDYSLSVPLEYQTLDVQGVINNSDAAAGLRVPFSGNLF